MRTNSCNINSWLHRWENRKQYLLHVYFVGDETLFPKIYSIDISEFTLKHPINLEVLQLRNIGGFATRDNLMPEAITYADAARAKKDT